MLLFKSEFSISHPFQFLAQQQPSPAISSRFAHDGEDQFPNSARDKRAQKSEAWEAKDPATSAKQKTMIASASEGMICRSSHAATATPPPAHFGAPAAPSSAPPPSNPHPHHTYSSVGEEEEDAYSPPPQPHQQRSAAAFDSAGAGSSGYASAYVAIDHSAAPSMAAVPSAPAKTLWRGGAVPSAAADGSHSYGGADSDYYTVRRQQNAAAAAATAAPNHHNGHHTYAVNSDRGGGGALSQYGASSYAKTEMGAVAAATLRGGGGVGGPPVGITSPALSPPNSPRQQHANNNSSNNNNYTSMYQGTATEEAPSYLGAAAAAAGGLLPHRDDDESFYRNNNLTAETDARLDFMRGNRRFAAGGGVGAEGSGRPSDNSFLSTANATLLAAEAVVGGGDGGGGGGGLTSPSPNRHLSPIAASMLSAPSLAPALSASVRGGAGNIGGWEGAQQQRSTAQLPLSQQFVSAANGERLRQQYAADRAAAAVGASAAGDGYHHSIQQQQQPFTRTAQTAITDRLFVDSQQPQQQQQLPNSYELSPAAAPRDPAALGFAVTSAQNNFAGLLSSTVPSSSAPAIGLNNTAAQQHSAALLASPPLPSTAATANAASHVNNTGNASTAAIASSLAPSPEALHAAALSLRRQEEALNAKELQLRHKEEELTRREFAVRQIILEALDVQGVAMVGGATVAPNVAGALANLRASAANNPNASSSSPNGGGKNGALSPSSASSSPQQQQQLFHGSVGALEEQMVHFRDEFRRQRTQLRQLYEELNTRERALEAAAVGVKKFEQKLKLRELELDTRARALIAEEDDMAGDAVRHAATLTASSEAMRKRLAALEGHEAALEQLGRDLDTRAADLTAREEASKQKIIAAKEAEDHVVRTLERAHDLELKAKALAAASDRLRIREEALWPAVSEIANGAAAREARAGEAVARAREEVAYLRKALDAGGKTIPPPPHADGSAAAATEGGALSRRPSGFAVLSPPPSATAVPPQAVGVRDIMRELERIGTEIRNASAANSGVGFGIEQQSQQPPAGLNFMD